LAEYDVKCWRITVDRIEVEFLDPEIYKVKDALAIAAESNAEDRYRSGG
jgi:hypothetical protein